MTDVLTDTKLTEEQKHYVGIIKSSGKHLLNVINDVLDIAVIEQGKLELENLPVSVKEIVNASFAILQAVAERKNINLQLDISSDIPEFVIADQTR